MSLTVVGERTMAIFGTTAFIVVAELSESIDAVMSLSVVRT